jgi:hypothetical protein
MPAGTRESRPAAGSPPYAALIARPAPAARDWVAIILAIGVATALNAIVAAVLIDALRSDGPGLSENATQVLTAAFGGIIGVLGAYIGYRAGVRSQAQAAVDEGDPG